MNNIVNNVNKSLTNVNKALPKNTKKIINITLRGIQLLSMPLVDVWVTLAPRIPGVNSLTKHGKHRDLKLRDVTKKVGVNFNLVTEHNPNAVDVQVPRYKLSPETLHKFSTWLESDNKNVDPENSINKGVGTLGKIGQSIEPIVSNDTFSDFVYKEKKLSAAEEQQYISLKQLYNDLYEIGGDIIVNYPNQGSLKPKVIINIPTDDKSLEEIKELVQECYKALGINQDSKMIETSALRLFEQSRQNNISSDHGFYPPLSQQQSVGSDNSGDSGYENSDDDVNPDNSPLSEEIGDGISSDDEEIEGDIDLDYDIVEELQNQSVSENNVGEHGFDSSLSQQQSVGHDDSLQNSDSDIEEEIEEVTSYFSVPEDNVIKQGAENKSQQAAPLKLGDNFSNLFKDFPLQGCYLDDNSVKQNSEKKPPSTPRGSPLINNVGRVRE